MKSSFILIASLLFLPCLFFSCSKEKVNEEVLINYINNSENGLRKTIEDGDFRVDLCYRPSSLFIAQELRNSGNYDRKLFDSISSEYSQNLYFILSLSRSNREIENQFAGNQQKYLEIVQYLNYGISENIKLTKGKEIIPLVGTVYSKMYGNSSRSSLLLVFKSAGQIDDALKFQLDDDKLGLGKVGFIFESKDIDKVPSLFMNL